MIADGQRLESARRRGSTALIFSPVSDRREQVSPHGSGHGFMPACSRALAYERERGDRASDQGAWARPFANPTASKSQIDIASRRAYRSSTARSPDGSNHLENASSGSAMTAWLKAARVRRAQSRSAG